MKSIYIVDVKDLLARKPMHERKLATGKFIGWCDEHQIGRQIGASRAEAEVRCEDN